MKIPDDIAEEMLIFSQINESVITDVGGVEDQESVITDVGGVEDQESVITDVGSVEDQEHFLIECKIY